MSRVYVLQCILEDTLLSDFDRMKSNMQLWQDEEGEGERSLVQKRTQVPRQWQVTRTISSSIDISIDKIVIKTMLSIGSLSVISISIIVIGILSVISIHLILSAWHQHQHYQHQPGISISIIGIRIHLTLTSLSAWQQRQQTQRQNCFLFSSSMERRQQQSIPGLCQNMI